MALALNTALRTTRANAIVTDAGSGALLKFYTATRPATGAAITSQTLLATVTFTGSLGSVSSGVITLGDPAAVLPVANGTTTWARLLRSDGTTFVADFDVATSGSDINLGSVSFSTAVYLDLSGGTITEGNA
jgi:hypothetical protein